MISGIPTPVGRCIQSRYFLRPLPGPRAFQPRLFLYDGRLGDSERSAEGIVKPLELVWPFASGTQFCNRFGLGLHGVFSLIIFLLRIFSTIPYSQCSSPSSNSSEACSMS